MMEVYRFGIRCYRICKSYESFFGGEKERGNIVK